MSELLPLFPLGTVLFPGTALPLHVFEERYRRLVRDLLARPEGERGFGVIGIELGHEVGPRAATRLAEVGCLARVRQVVHHDDGRFDLVAVGGARFAVRSLDRTMPYLRARVSWLPEEAGPEADRMAPVVAAMFGRYQDRLRELGVLGAEAAPRSRPPAEPVRLSHHVAAAMLLDRGDRQRLLAAEHAAARLALEFGLLRREMRLLGGPLPTFPAAAVLDRRVHAN